jgi:hypothetical protein
MFFFPTINALDDPLDKMLKAIASIRSHQSRDPRYLSEIASVVSAVWHLIHMSAGTCMVLDDLEWCMVSSL